MRAKIIAEVASNHGGDLELAKEFIHAAAEAGADYVKFQSWRAATVQAREKDPQYEWFVKSELSDRAHRDLMEECGRRGVGFLTTCFDVDRVEFLASLGLSEIKVGSADLTSRRLLEALRPRFEHILVSTGMGTEKEVEEAASLLSGGRFTLMHCVSLYPLPASRANLMRMQRLRRYTPTVGWSDHTEGIQVAKLAIAAGADYIEKHFCLGRNGPGRATAWDATPEELAELARYATEVEEIMGEEIPMLTPDIQEARARYISRFGDNR